MDELQIAIVISSIIFGILAVIVVIFWLLSIPEPPDVSYLDTNLNYTIFIGEESNDSGTLLTPNITIYEEPVKESGTFDVDLDVTI